MDKWRPAPPEMIEKFNVAIEAVPEARSRKMFGYPAVFAGGNMFAGLHQENMVLRLPDDERAEFLQIEGAVPFQPMPGRAMREYVVAPEKVLADEATLESWLRKAFEYARSLPPKVKKKR